MLRAVKSLATQVTLVFVVGAFMSGFVLAHEPDEEPSGDQDFIFGKNGEVNIKSNVIIGDLPLQKGKYKVEHRVEGGVHSFVFARITSGKSTQVMDKPIVIKSKTAFAGNKSSKSAMHVKEEKSGSNRVTSIAVSPENMEHTF